MAVTKMSSYDLKGVKLSFADWVSNISPTETPFCSMTGKEAISQTKFQWQTDRLPKATIDNAQIEGSQPTEDAVIATEVKTNNTQIFRRGVSVSDTANTVAYYGRGKEVGYQMSKASLELKRDMEKAFLFQSAATAAGTGTPPKTAGFLGQVSTKKAIDSWKTLTAAIADTGTGADSYKDPDTGAVVAFKTATSGSVVEKDLFDMTYQLYLANSKANVIMYHPKHAGFFSSLMTGAPGTRIKMFGSMDDVYNTEVDTIVDPLGQKFALVPNRLMPETHIYFFNPSDWTQMVLRAPKQIQLAKQGSSQEWMIEAEVGLRHRNPYASGILNVS